MDGAKPSRTAQAVTAERSVLCDMGVLADPLARTMLSPPMAAVCSTVRRLPYRMRSSSVTLAGLAARVLWFDAQVVTALGVGIGQIAVIGAGYDSRAWRFGRDGVHFFEADHPATQRDKRRRAPSPGPTYVAVDLTIQSAAQALLDRGLDPAEPVLFVMEGVTMYLTQDVVRRQLVDLAEMSTTGSRLAVDFLPPRQAGTALHRRQNRLQRLARVGSGERFRLTVDRAQAVELVGSSGWTVAEHTSLRDAARAVVPPGYALRVDAINAHKTLVAAAKP